MDQEQLALIINAFNQLPSLVSCVNSSGVYQFCNKQFEYITGISSKNIYGKSILQIFPNEVGEKLARAVQRVLKSQEKIIYEGQITLNGDTKSYEIEVIPLLDNQASIEGVLIYEENITARSEQLIRLKKSSDDAQSYLESIISHIPASVYWKDREGKILGGNLVHAKLAGFKSPAEVIGKTDYDFPWKLLADQVRANDLEVINTQRIQVFEEVGSLGYGNTENTFLTIKAPLYDASKNIVGVIGISMDITDRKKMERELVIAKEQAEAANKAKSAFIANMSHDIRTPLTGMIGISEVLESTGKDAKDRKYGHIIHESSERLLALLNDILEIVSAEEIKEESIKKEVFNLPERFEQVSAIFTPNAELKKVNLTMKIDRDLPTYVNSDRIKLDRILLNLVSNALKFTHEGQISLEAAALSKNDDVALIEFTISDTGVGIPEDKVGHIFDRFYKVVPSYEGKYPGFGIGLSIVKRYIELLKGKITVASKQGEGTTFKVILPLKIARAEDVITGTDFQLDTESLQLKKSFLFTGKQPRKTKNGNGHKKVLIIEDDNIARKLAIAAFQTEGFETHEVDNAEAGFKRVIDELFDLIVTDIGLPGMDGNQFTSLVRSWEKITNHKPLPIVGLSAHGQIKAKEAQEAGMDLLLSKPLNKEKVNEIKFKFFSESSAQTSEEEVPEEKEVGRLGIDLPDTEDELFKLASFPLFDEVEGLENSGGNLDLLKELLGMLVNESIPNESANIEGAYKSSNWDQVRALAHKLKGAALYCGTIRLRYACQYLERYILAGHSKLCDDLYSQLNEVLDHTLQEIKNYLLAGK